MHHDPAIRAPRRDTVLDRLSLDGFAVVEHLFSPRAVAEVDAIMSGLLARFETLARAKPLTGWPLASDMAPASTTTEGLGQPEILHPLSLCPELADTELFRAASGLAEELAGRVSVRFDHLVVKNPRSDAITPWHQDAVYQRWTRAGGSAVAERLHFWIPLQDVVATGGCLEYIPGSHRRGILAHDRVPRRSGMPAYRAVPDAADVPHPVPVSAGSAVLHLPRTLHRAAGNMTASPRRAWVIQFSRRGGLELLCRKALGQIPRARALSSQPGRTRAQIGR